MFSYFLWKETTHKPLKVAAAKTISPVSMLLVRLASMNVFMPCDNCHSVKSICIWSFSGPYRISPYSVRMRENTDQKNSEYGHFSGSGEDITFQKSLSLSWYVFIRHVVAFFKAIVLKEVCMLRVISTVTVRC